MRQADIALGTMALHRTGLNEAAPLKDREYLAYGIPVVTSYPDPDFTDDDDYILRLPNEASNLDNHWKQVVQFANQWRRRRVPRRAIEHLDMVYKESKRSAFFEQVVNAQT